MAHGPGEKHPRQRGCGCTREAGRLIDEPAAAVGRRRHGRTRQGRGGSEARPPVSTNIPFSVGSGAGEGTWGWIDRARRLVVVHLQRVWIPVAAEWGTVTATRRSSGCVPGFRIPWSTDSGTPVPTTRVASPRNVKMGFVPDGSDDRIGYMPPLDGLPEIADCCLWECA